MNYHVPFRSRLPECRYPNNYFLKYYGTKYLNGNGYLLEEGTTFEVMKFFPHAGLEHLLLIGSNNNDVVTIDATGNLNSARAFAPPTEVNHMITDVGFLPSDKDNVVIGCAEGKLESVNLLYNSRMKYRNGHRRTIREIATHKNEPHMFATCGKDGNIYIWDSRSAMSKLSILNAHGTSGPADITAIKFVSEKIIVTGSESESGLRFWDLRYQKIKRPMYTKTLPKGRVMALEPSRTGRNIYAVMSTNKICEYHYIDYQRISSHQNRKFNFNEIEQEAPSRILAYRRPLPCNDYTTRARYSPFSDHLLVGGHGATMYDLQSAAMYYNDLQAPDAFSDPIEPKFKFTMPCNDTPTTVDWSVDGRYIVTLSEREYVIWDRDWPKDEAFEPMPHDLNASVLRDSDAYITRFANQGKTALRVRLNPVFPSVEKAFAKPLRILYTEEVTEKENSERPIKKINLKRKLVDEENGSSKRVCNNPSQPNTPNRGQQSIDSFLCRPVADK